jgi:hypothetical protein
VTMPRFRTVGISLTEEQIEYLKEQRPWGTSGGISWVVRVLIDKYRHASDPFDDTIAHSDTGRLFQIPPAGQVWFNWGLIEQEARTDTPFQHWAKAILALRDGEVAISGDQWPLITMRPKMRARQVAAKAREGAHEAMKRKAPKAQKKPAPKVSVSEKPSKLKKKVKAK